MGKRKDRGVAGQASPQIRAEMVADIAALLRGRKEADLDPREQKIYYRMLDSYYSKMERLYCANNDKMQIQSNGENV